jgi:hypothetical protein
MVRISVNSQSEININCGDYGILISNSHITILLRPYITSVKTTLW